MKLTDNYLDELVAQLRDDADMIRSRQPQAGSGRPVRLAIDEAADAIQELRRGATISAEQVNLAAGYLSTTIAQYQHVMNVRGALRRALAEAGLTVAGGDR